MSNLSFLQGSTVYANNKYVPFKKATVSIASSPVQYGLAVYTACNVNVVGQQLVGFRLKDHYNRLVRSAKILGMQDFKKQCSYDEFLQII